VIRGWIARDFGVEVFSWRIGIEIGVEEVLLVALEAFGGNMDTRSIALHNAFLDWEGDWMVGG